MKRTIFPMSLIIYTLCLLHPGQLVAVSDSSCSDSVGSVFSEFITRDGDRLMEGNSEFRFAGVNMPGMSIPYDYTLRIPERLILPTKWEQEDGFKTIVQMNGRVLRLWNLPIRGQKDEWMDWAYVQKPGVFNEEAFKTLDQLLALANQYGIRVIFPFTAEVGDYLGGIGTYAQWRGKERLEFYTDPQCKEDYKTTIAYVLNRRNTITGQRYKDDKAILAWEFGNEMRRAPVEWEAEMADFIKSIDSNHLIMAGNDTRIIENPPENLDIYTKHYYGGDWKKRITDDRNASRGKRPLIVGEYGGDYSIENAKSFYQASLENGTAGHLVWSMIGHHRFGGYYWHQIFTFENLSSMHWPGLSSGQDFGERQKLELLRSFAFRMQGIPEHPIPTPEPPTLLSPDRLPMLSWQGSTGARTYRIERATNKCGPWTVLEEDCDTGKIAYRPLWHDPNTIPQQSYFYRVSAKNESGVSEPSNILGPVVFESNVFVDEFFNTDLCSNTEGELELNNSRNGLYAEYLYRLKGEIGTTIQYRIPGQITKIRIWTFHAHEVTPPQLLVDTQEVPLIQQEQLALEIHAKVKELTGTSQTMTKWQSELSFSAEKGNETLLTIKWFGPMEIDRIEVEFR